MPKEFEIAVFPGDGIGAEVVMPTLELLDSLGRETGSYQLRFETMPAGAAHYQKTGVALPDECMSQASAADAILLGAMGLPGVRYADGTEIAPQLDLRFALGLYAGVRPVKILPGLPKVLANPKCNEVDFVLIRESTEGLFASHGKGQIEDDREARDTMVITREISEQLFDFSFRLAQRRKDKGYAGNLTCVDKANVFASFAFFRSIFYEKSKQYPDIAAETAYVDATALNMIRQPWDFDVLVTENMFGDILSDLGAGLMGGMGMAPSADIGADHAVFQPCHGSAPDIVGQGKANPTATILSAAMMLDWLGEKHNSRECQHASSSLSRAVEIAYAEGGVLPYELGGTAGTEKICQKIEEGLKVVLAG